MKYKVANGSTIILGIIVLPLAITLAESVSNAQIVYYSSTLPMGSGPVISYFTNDRSGINNGSQAGNVAINPTYFVLTNIAQQWDFSTGPSNYIEKVSVVNVTNMNPAFRNQFPTATHALNYVQNGDDPGESWEFYSKIVPVTGIIWGFRKALIRLSRSKTMTSICRELLLTACSGREQLILKVTRMACTQ